MSRSHSLSKTAAAVLCGSLIWVMTIGVGIFRGAEPAERALAVRGIDLGTKEMRLYVARDKAAWDAVKKAAGDAQMLPIGTPKGDALERLNSVNFDKEMIVAVFWGQMSFAGEGEQCWIEKVTAGKDEVTVDCREKVWDGAVDHAYRAWPYAAKIVPRSDLPVKFVESTELLATKTKKEQTLATLKPDEWERKLKEAE